MPDAEKIVGWVVRTVGAALFAFGGSQLLGGEWFGRLIFTSFSKTLSIHLLNAHEIDAGLYQGWATQIVISAQPDQFGMREIAVIVVLLALVGHVVAKDNIHQVSEISAASKIKSLYRRHYFHLTFGTFFVLLVSQMMWVETSSQLLAIYLLIAVPILLYVVMHYKDILQVGFLGRFMCLSLSAIFLISTVILPQVFGSRMFDLSLRSVTIPKASRRKGIHAVRLLFDEQRSVVGDVFYNENDQLIIELLKQEGAKGSPSHVSLREVAAKARPRRVKPEDVPRIINAVIRASL